MALTDTEIKATKPCQKPYKLFDEKGLFLLVSPAGGRWWRFRYRLAGREKLISFGTYPDVPLTAARSKRDDARKLVAAGADPSVVRKAKRAAQQDSFQAVAESWLGLQAKKLQADTLARIRDRLTDWVFPHIGRLPIADIEAPELLACLRRIEARGTHETAHRTRADCGRIFRHAIACGLAKGDASAGLRGVLAPVKTTHFASITNPAEIGALLRAIDSYRGQPATEIALKLAPYLFVRPGELRAATWEEIDLSADEPIWRIPAARMKMRRAHLVPLAPQVAGLLRELYLHTGSGNLLFPTLRDANRSMSENTLNAALRRLGYTTGQMTAHGFRTMASTSLNESGWNPDLIELQLAHKERNETRGAYNRAERLTERRAMMQAWADYLDSLRAVKKSE